MISLFAQTELLSDNHDNYSVKHLIGFFSWHGQQRALDDETSRDPFLMEIKHYLCEVSSSSMPNICCISYPVLYQFFSSCM